MNGIYLAVQIETARKSLKILDASLGRIGAYLDARPAERGIPKKNHSPVPQFLSPKRRASLVLQGRYMGYMRHLKPKQKTRVRKIREAKGVKMAIQEARKLTKA